MAMLADTVELVIGVDTHKDTHTAAVVAAATGVVIAQATVTATPAGYQQLLRLADRHDGRRVWAIEGTGGYGAGLTRFLHAHHEQVAGRARFTAAVSSRIRRAKLRSVAAVLVVSTSQSAWTRMPAQAATSWRVERARSRSRKTSGAATTRAWSWRWASPAAWTAERRAASRTESAARGPEARGWAS